jgi:hypothetical protein
LNLSSALDCDARSAQQGSEAADGPPLRLRRDELDLYAEFPFDPHDRYE